MKNSKKSRSALSPLWTSDEDEVLKVAVFEASGPGRGYANAAKQLGRSKGSCRNRFYRIQYDSPRKSRKSPKIKAQTTTTSVKTFSRVWYHVDKQRFEAELLLETPEISIYKCGDILISLY